MHSIWINYLCCALSLSLTIYTVHRRWWFCVFLNSVGVLVNADAILTHCS